MARGCCLALQICKRRGRKFFILLLFAFLLFLALTIYHRRSTTYIIKTKHGIGARQRRLGSGLNVHVWFGFCPYSIQVLCDYPLFHISQNDKTTTETVDILPRYKADYGQRIFGFLHPPRTGKYKFAIASDDSSELWLSGDEDSSNAIRICNVGERNEEFIWTERGDFTQFASQVSKEIELQNGRKYFMEILHVQGIGNDFVQVAWCKPGTTKFEIIDPQNISLYFDKGEMSEEFESLPKSVACATQNRYQKDTTRTRIPQYVLHEVVKDVLPYCSYRPSYLNKQDYPSPINMYSFLYDHLFPVETYPHHRYKDVENKLPSFSQHKLPDKIAKSVVGLYTRSLQEKMSGYFDRLSVVNVERKTDEQLGSRFLLEVKVNVKGQSESLILSEYVFMPKNSSTLCYPEGFQWNRKADIALVITAKNQGRWLVHFLNNLHQIYSATQDQHVSLVIFNYADSSSDINLQHELDKRTLPPYKIVNYQAEHYSRSKSFNQAIKEVNDPHTIIFTVDLHLELPTSLFDDIRKHCFEGRSVYAPLFVKLNCDSVIAAPKGQWDSQEFGLVGIFKSDWERVGGLDEEENEEKLGQEKWDLMERVVGCEMEYERLRHPEIFRYYHEDGHT